MNFQSLESAIDEYGISGQTELQSIINRQVLGFLKGFADQKPPEAPTLSLDHWMGLFDFCLVTDICARSSVNRFLVWRERNSDPNFSCYAKKVSGDWEVNPRELIRALSLAYDHSPLLASRAQLYRQKHGF